MKTVSSSRPLVIFESLRLRMERGRSGGVLRAQHAKHPHISYLSRRFTKGLIFSILLFTLLLVGCGSGPEKTRKPSEDWSRGLPLGTDASGTVGMTIDQQGEGLHVIWPFWSVSGSVGLRYVQVDQKAQIKFDREVIQLSGRVRTPRLVAADDQYLHLFWANRAETAKHWQLWYAQLDHQGVMQGNAVQLSPATSGVSKYAIASDLNGGVVIVWEDTESGSIDFVRLSSSGEPQAGLVRVVSAGINPDLWVDEQGQVHLIWLDENIDLRYALIADHADFPLPGENLTHIPLGTGASLDGPALGVADGWVHVFWSILNQSGLEAGTAKTQQIAFPVGAPEKASIVSDIGVLPLEEQPYRPADGDFTYTQLVPAAYVNSSSEFVYAPVVMQGQSSELAVALAFRQQYRLDGYIQIVAAIMADGEYKGYAVTTKTQVISSDAVLSADAQGNLHLIWRDGFTGEDVYYTTIAPDARTALDRPTFRDIATVGLTGGLESVTGILLFPLAFPWMFLGLVILIGWRLINNDEDLTNKTSLVLLVVSILLYQFSKALVLPTMIDYVPFSAWIDVPNGWQLALRIGVPTVILAIAIGAAEWFRRKSSPSALQYYFVVVIVDTTLTLAIYGVNFLGAY